MKRPWPSPAAISRMEETLDWPKLLDPLDARILWLRAGGERWKTICWKVGLQRAAAHQHWLYGLCVLAWKLNGRHLPARRSKRYVIEMVRGKSGDRGPLYPSTPVVNQNGGSREFIAIKRHRPIWSYL